MVNQLATKKEFDDLLASSADQLIVVDFHAVWCGPCKVIGPKVEEFSKVYTDVIFVKVDVDENSETSEKCEVSAMPTFQFYKNGAKVDELIGANPSKLEEMIKKHINVAKQ